MVVFTPTQKNTCALSPHNIHKWWCPHLLRRRPVLCFHTISTNGTNLYLFKGRPGRHIYTISTNGTDLYLFKGRPGRHLYTISTTGGAHIVVQRPAWASSLYNIHNWRCIYTCSKDNLVIAAIQSPQMTKYPYLFKGQLTHRYRCRTISTNDEVPTPLQRTTQIPLSYKIHK